jgi:hypothetical protein
VRVISIAFGVLTIFVLLARLFARFYVVKVIGADDSKLLPKNKFTYTNFWSSNCVCECELYYSLIFYHLVDGGVVTRSCFHHSFNNGQASLHLII